jgi:metallo-beta-lactamase family protein
MKITFWGAAQQVTGSMHLVELESGTRILIDCGLDYEKRKEFEVMNATFPFTASDIDILILTHAHIDHSGNVPNLIKQGFAGHIVCSAPTLELSQYLLLDSLNIQLMDIRKRRKQYYRNKKKKSVKGPMPQALYSKRHVEDMMDMAVVLNPGQVWDFGDDLSLSFSAAGHILGAMSVTLKIKENGEFKHLGFTGDLGNYHSKLVPDPIPMKGLDYLVSESTYGGRKHATDSRNAEEILLEYITDTCVNRKGKLVIPAFSVGRTQAILFTIHQLYKEGKMPQIKVFTDSPLAIKSTRIYQHNIEYLNQEAKDFQQKHGSLFNFPLLHVVEDERESEYLSVLPEPCVIVSAAGMVEGGRIQMHVRNNIASDKNSILIAGFCAEGTLGDRLLKGQGFVEINRKERPVHAKIGRTDVFSAHPDHPQLLSYFDATRKIGDLKKLFLVHGEENQMKLLAEDIKGIQEVYTPMKGQSFHL